MSYKKAEQALREERKRLEKFKDEFISNVSHELRTPLSIIKEGISLVLDEIPGKINQQQNKMLTTAKNNIDRLTRLIDNLLDMSKIESGKLVLRRESIDIKMIMKEVATNFVSQVNAKGLEIKLNYPKEKLPVFADADRIAKVFTNLLSNAVKFTEKGYIEISAREKNGSVECSVKDTGIGIARNNLSKIFDKFEQFSRSQGPGEKGTGIGLSIAKKIIELHQGKIWVESRFKEGTTITFTLPIRQEER